MGNIAKKFEPPLHLQTQKDEHHLIEPVFGPAAAGTPEGQSYKFDKSAMCRSDPLACGLIQWVNDLEAISHANNEYQWLLSYVLVTSIAIVSIGSMFVLASGPVGILAGIGLMVLLNVIKSMALKQIFMVRSRNRRYIG